MTDEATMEAELPLDTAGARLLRAREAAGLSLKQVAEATKIPERHLLAIERGEFATLPARTYATGFARSYAKAVGIDETAIVATVREELSAVEPEAPRRAIQTFEPGDPSRLPSSALVWGAALLALVLVVGALAWWRSGSGANDELPPLVTDETPAASGVAAVPPAVAPTGGPVVFTALAPDVWVKFYDGNGVQLLQKQLAQGESYTVPTDNPQVLLWTARPEALAITVGGKPVAKLAEVQQMLKDVPVTAAALLARGVAPAAPASAAPVAAEPVVRPRERSTPLQRRSAPREAAPPAIQQKLEPVMPPVVAPPAAAPAAAAT